MKNMHLRIPLTVAIHPTVALLHTIRVPRDLVMDQLAKMILQVEALRGGISRKQDPNWGVRRICLESGFDPLAVVELHSAIHGHESLSARELLRSQEIMKPL